MIPSTKEHRTTRIHRRKKKTLTGLGLSDDVALLDARQDGALLDGRGTLVTVGVDSAQQSLLQVHVVEGFGDLVPGGLDDALRGHAGRSILVLQLLFGFTVFFPAGKLTEIKIN